MALDFHRIGLAGQLSNIPAAMLTGLIVPLGFITLALTFVWTRLALLFAKALGLCAGWLVATVNWFGRLPRVAYRVPGPPTWLLITFCVAIICLAAAARAAAARRMSRFARRQPTPCIHPAEWVAAFALAVAAILIAAYPFAPSLPRGKLEVTVLDVGQGDSIFVAFPDGRTMLIFGGGRAGSEWIEGYRSGIDVGEEVVSPYLWSREVKRLDVVALTHAHNDHVDGLHSVLQNFHAHELWVGRDEETPAFESLLAEARARGVAIIHRESGSEFSWDRVAGDTLWPEDPTPAAEASNDDSLVMHLRDNQVRFLFSGDIEKPVENKLAGENDPLESDFLKAPTTGASLPPQMHSWMQ
jgi:competence protein ComEC